MRGRILGIKWKASVLALTLVSSASAGTAWLAATVHVTGSYTATINVTTSLPDGVTLAAKLVFNGAKAADPALDTKLYKVKVQNGRATINMDESRSMTSLPTGSYKVTIFYSPIMLENQKYFMKGYKDYNSKDLLIKLVGDKLNYSEILGARPAFDRAKATYLQMPVEMDTQKVLSNFKRYGNYEVVKFTGSAGLGNAYYFKKIDGTLVIFGPGNYDFIRGRVYRPK